MGLDPADVTFGETRNAFVVWTRITALKVKIESFEFRGPFRAFYQAHRPEILAAELSYAALVPSARRRLALLRLLAPERQREDRVSVLLSELDRDFDSFARPTPVPEAAELILPPRIRRKLEILTRVEDSGRDRPIRDLVDQMDAEFVAQVSKLEDQMLGIAARAILHSGKLETTRKAMLRRLGFMPAEVCRDPFLDSVFLLFLALVVGYLIVLAATPASDLSVGEKLLTGVLVAVVYGVGILAAVFPKRWAFFQRGRSRPYVGYAVSGVVAVVTWIAVFMTMWTVMRGDVASAVAMFKTRWPWIVMAFAGAFSTAWCADNRSRWFPSWIAAVSQGLVFGAAAVGVVVLLREVNSHEAALPLWNPRHGAMVAASMVTGIGIGATVPQWWRQWRGTTVPTNSSAPAPDGGLTTAVVSRHGV